MLTAVMEALACPSCRGRFEVDPISARDVEAPDLFLLCATCRTASPAIAGFPLFPETRRGSARGDRDWLEKERARWLDEAAFAEFLQAKSERNLYDGYAFFQPFNESSRALLALVEVLREGLSPGDLILDTWCRTGWSGEWLASLFPEQQVLSIWEGNSNVLGYRGFAHWLSAGRRRPNLEILFSHADEPLPIASDAVDLVIGLDSLHRYDPESFLPECLRVARDDAVLFFPHVHLTNSEPEPFFERGCRQLHGREWKALLDERFAGGPRAPYILAEPDLFDCGESFTIEDDPETAHYNGAVLIAPREWQGRRVRTGHTRPLEDADRLVLNPLLQIDLSNATVEVRGTHAGNPVAAMLERHPIYRRRLEERLGRDLSGIETQVLFLAEEARTLGAIAEAIGVPSAEVRESAGRLCHREIAFAASVSETMAQLQDYYGSLRTPQDPPTCFAELWRSLGERYGDEALILAEDGTAYDWPAVSSLVQATARWLERETAPQDRVLLHAPHCPELLLVVWACWLTGRVAVPVDSSLPPDVVRKIVERVSPALRFSDLDLGGDCLGFDSLAPAESDSGRPLYSDRIEPYLDAEDTGSSAPGPRDTALLLFTSGSTGEPKAVRLDARGLLHSAHALARHFGWSAGGRLLSLGPPHTMSGLRNPALAALVAGATVVMPDPGLVHPARVLQLIRDHEVRYLVTVPALLQQLCNARDRLRQEARPAHLEQILTTGQALAARPRADIEAWLAAPVRSYYGLTETGGICTADPLEGRLEGNLGRPVGSVAQAVEGDRVLARGEVGELRVFSPANMQGYWEAGTTSSVRRERGWIHTGDVVRLLADGSFDFIGRLDDQVKNRHGELLYLQELERVAASLPEVLEACCLEDEGVGIVLFAVLAPGQDPKQVRNRSFEEIDRVLGARKRPDEMREVPSIRRLSSGKVDRKGMFECA